MKKGVDTLKQKYNLSLGKNILVLYLITLFFVMVSCEQHPKADKIYINGTIWTGDPSNPKATAIGIKDSTFLFVSNEYEDYKDDQTEIIDLDGKMVVPGFIDNHTHFLSGGYQLTNVNLRNASTPKDFINILGDFSSSAQENQWIQGGDWDHETWGGELPQKKWIDSVTGKNPVFINRYDGHMALANSVTLKLAGIDRNTINPTGGEIVKDPVTGEPTGVLKDEAMNLVYDILPDASISELDASLQRAMQHAFANGVTQVHDMGSYGGWDDLETYRRAYSENKLPLRVYSFVPLESWEKLDSYVKDNGVGNSQLRWGGLKGFVDGSLGSTTAWFYEPYLDEPGQSGLVVTDPDSLKQWITKADSVGLQVAVHAIGDRANDWVLDVFSTVSDKNKDASRFRIEHAQHLSTEAFSEFKRLEVIASMQPYHAIDDGRWAAKRLDDNRLKRTYPFKSVLDHDIRLTFGSDWTVGPLSPILGIYAAVTRRTLDGKNPNGWYPEQKITVEQALKSYTVNNAYAGFMENKTGMVKSGMLADFVVLSDNLMSIPPKEIEKVTVLRTVVNGKEVFINE